MCPEEGEMLGVSRCLYYAGSRKISRQVTRTCLWISPIQNKTKQKDL